MSKMQAIHEEESLVDNGKNGKTSNSIALKMRNDDEDDEVHNNAVVAQKAASDEVSYAKLVWVRIEFITFGEVDTLSEKYQAEVKIRSKWYLYQLLTSIKAKSYSIISMFKV